MERNTRIGKVTSMKLLALILLSVTLSGAGQILLRGGLKSVPTVAVSDLLSIAGWSALLSAWQVSLGLLLWVLATALWLLVLNRAELSYAYCLGSLNYIAVPLAGRYLFQEGLNGTRVWGMVLIFCGVLLTIYGNLRR
jgi:multidrug transporter EmrE-like cation transporter